MAFPSHNVTDEVQSRKWFMSEDEETLTKDVRDSNRILTQGEGRDLQDLKAYFCSLTPGEAFQVSNRMDSINNIGPRWGFYEGQTVDPEVKSLADRIFQIKTRQDASQVVSNAKGPISFTGEELAARMFLSKLEEEALYCP